MGAVVMDLETCYAHAGTLCGTCMRCVEGCPSGELVVSFGRSKG